MEQNTQTPLLNAASYSYSATRRMQRRAARPAASPVQPVDEPLLQKAAVSPLQPAIFVAEVTHDLLDAQIPRNARPLFCSSTHAPGHHHHSHHH